VGRLVDVWSGLPLLVALSPILGHLPPAGGREEHHPLEVIHQILQAHFRPGPHQPDGPDEGAAHRRHLMPEDMFHP
jgi:hypothetical protein